MSLKMVSISTLLSLSLVGVVFSEISPAQAGNINFNLINYNIHHGEGEDGSLDLPRIAAVIQSANAQVVTLQEVDVNFSSRSNFVDQANFLATALGMEVVFGANLSLPPLTTGAPQRQYGTATLSSYPIIASSNTFLPKPGNTEQRGLLEALINVGGTNVKVYNTHLESSSASARTLQVNAIVDQVSPFTVPTILAGDLNAQPNDSELQPLFGIFEDVWNNPSLGPGYTIDSLNPNARIDYILVSPGITFDNQRVIQSFASDHLPVVSQIFISVPEPSPISGIAAITVLGLAAAGLTKRI